MKRYFAMGSACSVLVVVVTQPPDWLKQWGPAEPGLLCCGRNRRTEEKTITYISGNFQERSLYSALNGQPESHLRKLCACAPTQYSLQKLPQTTESDQQTFEPGDLIACFRSIDKPATSSSLV
ncbi:unnamed protein product [Lota lota]